MTVSNYTKEFIDKLLKEFPSFNDFYEEKKDENNIEYIFFNIPSKSQIWISTHLDEITVGFYEQHQHFSYHDTKEEDFEEAISFIKKII